MLTTEKYVFQLAEHENQQVRTAALDALDRAICGVLASEHFQQVVSRTGAGGLLNGDSNDRVLEVEPSDMNGKSRNLNERSIEEEVDENGSLECALILPLCSLYNDGRTTDVRPGALRILMHVLEVRSTNLE